MDNQTTSNQTAYTIGQLAALAGVTTKTLRHYDRIGLLHPTGRSEAGYRLYSDNDGHRLAEILAYRALDVPLEQIAILLAEPKRADRLSAHLEEMRQKRRKLDGLIYHLEEMIRLEKKGAPMSAHDELNGFAHNPYEDEARDKWGDTDAWKESQRRTKSYTATDWEQYKAEAADINERFVALMQGGVPAKSAEARALAEEHRQLISQWFYECSPQMHAGFGDMWDADPRFKHNIDKAGVGLAEYMAAAFRAAAE